VAAFVVAVNMVFAILLVHTGDPYSPAAFAALDCGDEKARRSVVDDDPAQPIVACSEDGSEKYYLDVAKVVGTDVKTAAAQRDQQLGEWQVIVKFTGKGQNKWTDLTAATVQKRVAVALDAVVISAPTIQERIALPSRAAADRCCAALIALAYTRGAGSCLIKYRRIVSSIARSIVSSNSDSLD